MLENLSDGRVSPGGRSDILDTTPESTTVESVAELVVLPQKKKRKLSTDSLDFLLVRFFNSFSFYVPKYFNRLCIKFKINFLSIEQE